MSDSSRSAREVIEKALRDSIVVEDLPGGGYDVYWGKCPAAILEALRSNGFAVVRPYLTEAQAIRACSTMGTDHVGPGDLQYYWPHMVRASEASAPKEPDDAL